MDITAQVITDFRTAKPAFSDIGKWPDVTVTEAMCEADAETGGKGWGAYDGTDCHNFKARGLFLYTCHWLTSNYPSGAICPEDVKSDARLGVASKSVGDESISFVTTSLGKLSIGDGWLATTSYGQQWLRLRRRAGVGALAL